MRYPRVPGVREWSLGHCVPFLSIRLNTPILNWPLASYVDFVDFSMIHNQHSQFLHPEWLLSRNLNHVSNQLRRILLTDAQQRHTINYPQLMTTPIIASTLSVQLVMSPGPFCESTEESSLWLREAHTVRGVLKRLHDSRGKKRKYTKTLHS